MAPRIVSVRVEGGDDLLGRALLQFPHEADGVGGRLGADQQMKVLRHQHPADHQEPGFLAELAQRLDKNPTEALASKQPAAAIGAGGDKLQLAGLKMASVDRHTWDIGGHGDSRESQSWARSAPAGCAEHV